MSDTITVKMDPNQRTFAPCPVGNWPSVCVDVIDMGEAVEQYMDQPAHLVHKAVLVFQTDEENPETHKRFEPSIEFTIAAEYEPGEGLRPTFGAKSKLRKMLGAWRGKAYTDDEAKAGAPLHKLVGVNAVLNVLHKTSKQERTYAVIDSISAPIKGLPKLIAHTYERSEHWAKRKEEYAGKVAEFRRAQPEPEGFDKFPAALEDDRDDSALPF